MEECALIVSEAIGSVCAGWHGDHLCTHTQFHLYCGHYCLGIVICLQCVCRLNHWVRRPALTCSSSEILLWLAKKVFHIPPFLLLSLFPPSLPLFHLCFPPLPHCFSPTLPPSLISHPQKPSQDIVPDELTDRNIEMDSKHFHTLSRLFKIYIT